MRFMGRSPLRGGIYHLALIFLTSTSFNWAFYGLTGVNIGERVFSGVVVPMIFIYIAVCISAVIVLWNNWVD